MGGGGALCLGQFILPAPSSLFVLRLASARALPAPPLPQVWLGALRAWQVEMVEPTCSLLPLGLPQQLWFEGGTWLARGQVPLP